MYEDLVLQLGLIIILGILAQWIGWLLKTSRHSPPLNNRLYIRSCYRSNRS